MTPVQRALVDASWELQQAQAKVLKAAPIVSRSGHFGLSTELCELAQRLGQHFERLNELSLTPA